MLCKCSQKEAARKLQEEQRRMQELAAEQARKAAYDAAVHKDQERVMSILEKQASYCFTSGQHLTLHSHKTRVTA
jgi:hypothetical protein